MICKLLNEHKNSQKKLLKLQIRVTPSGEKKVFYLISITFNLK